MSFNRFRAVINTLFFNEPQRLKMSIGQIALRVSRIAGKQSKARFGVEYMQSVLIQRKANLRTCRVLLVGGESKGYIGGNLAFGVVCAAFGFDYFSLDFAVARLSVLRSYSESNALPASGVCGDIFKPL